MDTITLIVDAATLIDRIQTLKQWIYDGSIHVLIPTSTLQEVEARYKASVAKVAPKEPTLKKATGRAARREEQPLFDLNPRTAWEFLSRELSEQPNAHIGFQQEGEEFSQWSVDCGTNEEAEEPVQPPASFADALLRKLNITDGPNPSITKGAQRPHLISRASDPKTPWTQQVPALSAEGIPPNLKSFFSYVLWRMHEVQGDRLLPNAQTILTDGAKIKEIGATLGIQVYDWLQLRQLLTERRQAIDHRAAYGELERDFSNQKLDPPADISSNRPHGHASHLGDISTADHPAVDSSPTIIPPASASIWNQRNSLDYTENSNSTPLDLRTSIQAPIGSLSPAIGTPRIQNNGESAFSRPLEQANANKRSGEPSPITSHHASLSGAGLDEKSEGLGSARLIDDSELDSDEEIIVFEPRSKRLSGRPKSPAALSNHSRSRPTTANGPRETRAETPKPAKSPIKSSLKPQSPVFTPGKLYASAGAVGGTAQTTSLDKPADGPSKSPSRPALMPQPKPSTLRPPPSGPKPKSGPIDEARRQQSEIIIQRQREAIQRQAKAAAKPPPRKVQLEPTDNPTIIDPDAFDRSYVVEPPSHSVDRGGRRRGTTRPRPTSKGNHSHANGAHREPDDDFVLKSGTPRGSMRGKGKLFVP